MSSNESMSEQSRPDPPSSWEIQQGEYNEMEFLDAASEEPPFDVEHSLPTVEEIHADRGISWRRNRQAGFGLGKGSNSTRFYAIIAVCLAALIAIIGFSAGIAASDNNSASESTVVEDPAKRDTDLLNLLFKTYKNNGLDTTVLTKKGTPQFQAFQWIADIDPRHAAIEPSIVQRYALAVMYFALGGSDWTFKESRWMKSAHECDWNFGVKTDQIPPSSDTDHWVLGVQCTGGDQLVDRIVMPNNNLQGELPQEMGLLTNMVHFSVYKNGLTGELPQSLRLWTSLKFFAVESNQFSGQLGSWFNFPKLEYLTLGNNQFSGDIPTSFYEMTSLYEAALDNNMFTGGIDVFNKCTNLKILYLQKNSLDGTLTEDTFSEFTHLKDLDLSENMLKGAFPSAFYRVENVDLHSNQLDGALPEIPYDDSHNLSFLSAYKNKLKGSIPASISFLSSLTHLDLSQNQLSGNIPDEIQELTGLEYLFLQKNPFTQGRIPSLYGLSNLKEISLQETNRNSSIPAYIGEELKNVVLFDVHENALTGSIPTEFGLMSNMRFLFLNKNQLTGNLPWQLMYMQKLAIFMIDQNNFSGSDAAVCGSNKPTTLTKFFADCNEIQCDCCTTCCASDDPSCNTLELQVHDDNDFSRDHYVFGENLVFSRND